LTNSVLQDAEVHGAFHSYNSTGSRLDLLSDEKLYQDIETQIRTQLSIALSSGKEDLMSFSSESFSGHVPVIPGGTISSHEKVHETALPSEENEIRSGITRVKLRLRQENIVLVDEFDYDIKSSGIEGCDPFSIANSLVEDLKLPPEFIIHVSVSIVEQMYGIRVSDAIEKFTSNSTREVPSALTNSPYVPHTDKQVQVQFSHRKSLSPDCDSQRMENINPSVPSRRSATAPSHIA